MVDLEFCRPRELLVDELPLVFYHRQILLSPEWHHIGPSGTIVQYTPLASIATQAGYFFAGGVEGTCPQYRMFKTSLAPLLYM